jgi:hypothetical protein
LEQNCEHQYNIYIKYFSNISFVRWIIYFLRFFIPDFQASEFFHLLFQGGKFCTITRANGFSSLGIFPLPWLRLGSGKIPREEKAPFRPSDVNN